MINKLIILPLIAWCSISFAQHLESSIEKKSIYIGEHNTLVLDASSVSTSIKWRTFNVLTGVRMDAKNKMTDTIQLEVLNQVIDSIKQNVLRISFTAWDSGVVTILPIVLDSIQEWIFDPQLVWVKFPDINPEGDILDIEEGRVKIEAGTTEGDFWTIFTWILIGIIVLGGIIAFILYKKRKQRTTDITEIQLSLREQTEQKLHELFARKYWQDDKQKLHFIMLTEIMRWYVAKRYHIDALEKTTMELNAAMRMKLIDAQHIAILTEMLKQADFVKFAKVTLPSDEVEVLNQQALSFIAITELVETEETE